MTALVDVCYNLRAICVQKRGCSLGGESCKSDNISVNAQLIIDEEVDYVKKMLHKNFKKNILNL